MDVDVNVFKVANLEKFLCELNDASRITSLALIVQQNAEKTGMNIVFQLLVVALVLINDIRDDSVNAVTVATKGVGEVGTKATD